ncbi:MAG: diacylglycerol kinase family lipid kinase [Bacteroidales bacterium]|nr:diacylglycerol kinase family lipid kinase [Bacteroidales bacterium]
MNKKSHKSEKERIVFIINPVSGEGKTDKLVHLIQHHIHLKSFLPELIVTRYKGHATKIARKFIKNGVKKIIAVGGDGTVNEIASELAGKEAVLGIIPHGSGNGLARHLGIPLRSETALNVLNTGKIKRIDAGKANNRLFFCTCGTGFDARVGKMFDKQDGRGFMNYVRTVIRELMNYRPKKYRIRIDGNKYRQRAFLITIANSGQYGGNAYIAPEARIDDGLLDICIFRPFPRFASVILGLRLFNRTIDKSRYLDIFKGREIIIQRKKNIRMHLDGEPVKMNKKVKVTVLAGSLRVIVPG